MFFYDYRTYLGSNARPRLIYAKCFQLTCQIIEYCSQEGLEFQLLLNRFGAEQFLARLSQSAFAQKFVFKGGSLLAYLIDTDRKTKDLDFTIKHLSNQVDEITAIIKSVLETPVDDCLEWGEIEGSALTLKPTAPFLA